MVVFVFAEPALHERLEGLPVPWRGAPSSAVSLEKSSSARSADASIPFFPRFEDAGRFIAAPPPFDDAGRFIAVALSFGDAGRLRAPPSAEALVRAHVAPVGCIIAISASASKHGAGRFLAPTMASCARPPSIAGNGLANVFTTQHCDNNS